MTHDWTTHGHACCMNPGPPIGDRDLRPVARCGGPGLCRKCSVEAAQIRERADPQRVDFEPVPPRRVMVTIVYPRPWWRRLLRLPAVTRRAGPFEMVPWADVDGG